MKRTFSLTGISLALFALTLGACDDISVVGSGNGNTGGSSSVTTPAASSVSTASNGDTGGSSGVTMPATSSASTSSGSGGAPATLDNKLDILIEVDNSRSMADKQEVLSVAISDFVQSLANPLCLDGSGVAIASQPSSGLDKCPVGSTRAFTPINDVHVGVISSSLGSHGADTCLPTETVGKSCPNPTQANTTNDDKGHLLTRSDACGGTQVPTYNNNGFLAWDPAAKASPPGDTDINSFTSKLKTLVLGAGQIGCGFESQLESWYRFLVDPNPYSSITFDPQTYSTVPSGTDTALLNQRAAFLRPDSLVAIIMLSDEDDCSVKDGGIAFYALQQRQPGKPDFFHFPRARQECETNPNDVCCRSCTASQDGCPVDPNCSSNDPSKIYLSDEEDPLNLRCFDQKRRFGYNFLQPIDRYRAGLQDAKIADRDGNMVSNPLFVGGRDPGRVILTGIVGVPWQLIARDSTDLRKGYKNAGELNVDGADSSTTWEKILGDPSKNQAPKDQHMIPSRSPRPGLPATSSAPGTDPYNGHEYTTDKHGDLEYACIFPLITPRDCNGASDSCDCTVGTTGSTDNPLCDPKAPTKQVNAKAYPGLRELDVLKHLGSQGVTASICPSQEADAARSDFAYRPALRALLERIQPHLPK